MLIREVWMGQKLGVYVEKNGYIWLLELDTPEELRNASGISDLALADKIVEIVVRQKAIENRLSQVIPFATDFKSVVFSDSVISITKLQKL